MKITLSVTLPDDLAQEFLQAIRDFDTKYDPNHEDKIIVQMLGVGNQTAETDGSSLRCAQAAHGAHAHLQT